MDNNTSTQLKKLGLKATGPRIKILNFLEETGDRHLTAEEVYRKMLESGEEIGLATVYRVLTQFVAAGILQRHHFENERASFELAEAGHHDHMVCTQCGHIVEFFDEEIEKRQKAIAESHGFTISDHSLYLYGTCKGMAEKGVCSIPSSPCHTSKKDELG